MSKGADISRDKRQHWAAPDGWHDRKIRVLAIVLPGALGMVAAAMMIGPLFTHGEISFLLDRNKVAVTNDRLRVADAMYRGEDRDGRPFTVTAGSAVQASAREPVVRMEQLAARILLADGPAELLATRGAYNYQTEAVNATGPVSLTGADGYRISTQNVAIDLREKRITGSDGVSGTIPSGTFSADRISADLEARAIYLDGHVRLLFQQHGFRMPR